MSGGALVRPRSFENALAVVLVHGLTHCLRAPSSEVEAPSDDGALAFTKIGPIAVHSLSQPVFDEIAGGSAKLCGIKVNNVLIGRRRRFRFTVPASGHPTNRDTGVSDSARWPPMTGGRTSYRDGI
jgi:hypothetical protein